MEGGMILMFWNIKSRQVKQKFKCVLTELKYCGEGLVVQEDYYCCLNNFLFTVNYINLSLENNEVFCWIVHRNLCWLWSLGGEAALSLR